MTSPISIGTTPIIVVPVTRNRDKLILQNVSFDQILYIKKLPLTGSYLPVSSTNFDFAMQPYTGTPEFEGREPYSTNSICSFMVVSSEIGGLLAISETIKI